MARPPQDPQIRINEILNAAEVLFYEHGYHPTMISDIVKKIGVAQGTFYYYFTSKEEIIDALINRHLSMFISEIDAMVYSDHIDSLCKIELMGTIMLNTIRYNQGLFLEFLYNDQYLHLMDKMFRQAKTLLAPYLLIIIEEGKRNNIFHVSHNKSALNAILALTQCLVESIYEKESDEIIADQMSMVKILIEYALGVPGGTLQI